MKKGEKELEILEDDLRVKLPHAASQLSRQPIGFVMRGGFSQARGQGMGFGVICFDEVNALLGINHTALTQNLKGKHGALALFRKPTSVIYQPCWLLN